MKIEAIVVAEVSEREVQLSKTNGGLEIVLPPSMHTTKVVVRVTRSQPEILQVIDEQATLGQANGAGAGVDPGRGSVDLPA